MTDSAVQVPDFSDIDVSNREGAKTLYQKYRRNGEHILYRTKRIRDKIAIAVDLARENLRAAEQIRYAYESFYRDPIEDGGRLLPVPEFRPGAGQVGSFEALDDIYRRLNKHIRENYPHLSPYVRGEDD